VGGLIWSCRKSDCGIKLFAILAFFFGWNAKEIEPFTCTLLIDMVRTGWENGNKVVVVPILCSQVKVKGQEINTVQRYKFD